MKRTLLLYALLAASWLLVAPGASADSIYLLLDHGFGNQGPDYGLRVDTNVVNTFSFEQGAVPVTMTFHTASNTATIAGEILHNQSGQLWGLSADLSAHVLTSNATEWRSDTTGDFYDEMIVDFGTPAPVGADNHFSADAMDLKDETQMFDRIGFTVLSLTLTQLQDPGYDGPLNLYDYPQGPNEIPFLLVRGHRLSSSSDEFIVGIGWLNDVQPPGTQTKSHTRDFLFRVGPLIPEPQAAVLFGAGALVVGVALRRRIL